MRTALHKLGHGQRSGSCTAEMRLVFHEGLSVSLQQHTTVCETPVARNTRHDTPYRTQTLQNEFTAYSNDQIAAALRTTPYDQSVRFPRHHPQMLAGTVAPTDGCRVLRGLALVVERRQLARSPT